MRFDLLASFERRLAVALCCAVLASPEAFAQTPTPAEIATREAELEAGWAAFLAHGDSEPEETIQAFGTLAMMELMLARSREMAAGVETPALDGAALNREILAKWRRLQPSSAGPDLVPLFEIADLAEKQRRTLALLDRYPDSPLVIHSATMLLRHNGEGERAEELLEGLIQARPNDPVGYRLLVQHYSATQNVSRRRAAVVRWAEVAPGDPRLTTEWLAANLEAQEPALTSRVVESFLATPPARPEGVNACVALARHHEPSYADRGRACLVRLAAGDSRLAEAATSGLLELTAAAGDWDSFVSAIAEVDPARGRATIANVASRLAAPAQCEDRIAVIRLALDRFPPGEGDATSLSWSLATCADRGASVELFLELLRRSDEDQALAIVQPWAGMANGRRTGPLPVAETRAVLEARLAKQATAGIFSALDRVYEFGALDDERLALLARWDREAPDSFSGDSAVAFASLLAERGDGAEAARVLERQLETTTNRQTAEALWDLYTANDRLDDAAELARRCQASEDVWLAGTGHVLAARSSLRSGEPDQAKRHYEAALAKTGFREWAAELLALVAWKDGSSQAVETARELCATTSLANHFADPQACSRDLLAAIRDETALAAVVSEQGADLPAEPQQLLQLARQATGVGELDVAERALRKLRSIDPLTAGTRGQLAVVLERKADLPSLEELLAEVRQESHRELPAVLAATGRAYVAAQQPRRGIDLLLEARAGLAEGASPRGVDEDLRRAYAALAGQPVPDEVAGESLPRLPTAPPSDLRARLADPAAPPADEARRLWLEAAAFRSGAGGIYDEERARRLIEQAALLGDPMARMQLALLMTLAAGTPIDRSRRDRLFATAAAAVTERAKAGDADAAYLIGTSFLLGLGGKKDPVAARRWLEPAAMAGQSWALHHLAWMKQTGTAYEKPDAEGALDDYRKAARSGNAASAYSFADLALRIENRGAICREGLTWLESAARSGLLNAIAFLGRLLYYGRGECVAADHDAAFSWLDAAVARGHRGSKFVLALAMAIGDRPTAGAKQIFDFFAVNEADTDILTLETVAFLSATGIGVDRNPARARHLIARAAELGSDLLTNFNHEVAWDERSPFRRLHDRGVAELERLAPSDPRAASFLAGLYWAPSVISDPAAALRLARPAAEAGDPDAMRLLGQALRDGRSIQQDLVEAVAWLRRGAEGGNSFCMMFLAHQLLYGQGVEQDPQAALAWLTKAGQAGNWWAVADLGRLYSEGWQGLPRDDAKAAEWRRKSARAGNDEARGWLAYRGLSADP